jgi:hypothetical protein
MEELDFDEAIEDIDLSDNFHWHLNKYYDYIRSNTLLYGYLDHYIINDYRKFRETKIRKKCKTVKQFKKRIDNTNYFLWFQIYDEFRATFSIDVYYPVHQVKGREIKVYYYDELNKKWGFVDWIHGEEGLCMILRIEINEFIIDYMKYYFRSEYDLKWKEE